MKGLTARFVYARRHWLRVEVSSGDVTSAWTKTAGAQGARFSALWA
ncbi:MAG: hypothetical protein FWD46_04465 [Cystobacterineae bacterium]|nr:hypothetical protein [Cystobacterineae bacterium]